MRPLPRPHFCVKPVLPMLALCAGIWLAWPAPLARAQNDWQFPDPYFGILEIEKSHDPRAMRRYRAEVRPAPKKEARVPPAVLPPATADAPATPTWPRWRNRWRR